MNILSITNNTLCSGCGTCNAICPHDAISMEVTPSMGLLYASLDINKCINCGLCARVCPSATILSEKDTIDYDSIIGENKGCYVGHSLDKQIYENSQSGGIVTAISKYLLDNNLVDAVISCRMEYEINAPKAHYYICLSVKDIYLNQKSCYTQVDIVSALKQISGFRSVAIIGLPCHIQGVTNLQRVFPAKYANVKYKIGLICDKSYSQTYAEAIVSKLSSSLPITIDYRHKDFVYKGKYYSYQEAPTVVKTCDRIVSVIPNTRRMFLKDFFTVPKCNLCYDKLNKDADIVLGDPWGLDGKYDKEHGDSVIIVRSSIGASILASLQDAGLIAIKEVSIDEVAEGQRIPARVRNIHSLDWKAVCADWASHESISKDCVINHVNRLFYWSQVKVQLRSILGRIKRGILQ